MSRPLTNEGMIEELQMEIIARGFRLQETLHPVERQDCIEKIITAALTTNSIINGIRTPKSPMRARLAAVVGAMLLMLCAPLWAAEIPENLAVRAIIGEASNQGPVGMQAVAEAIRNRGHLRGVFGVRAKHVDAEPAWVWKQARQAWERSSTSRLVLGADHWECESDFGKPAWAKSMTKTVTIGKHTFYRSRSNG